MFDGINSIVSRGLHAADRSVIRTDNSRGIPEGDTASGVCWGCVIASNIAVAQFHNPSRCAAKTSSSAYLKGGGERA